ncbi:hypothetical protein GCM10020254_79190 [Streptomyces goshikiensis]
MVYACAGLGALCAAVLPTALAKRPLSLPMVFLAAGFLVFLLPFDALPALDPVRHRSVVEHLTEVCVVIALMGAGLAINRPPGWRAWSTTWRLLGLAMPLTILVTAAAAGVAGGVAAGRGPAGGGRPRSHGPGPGRGSTRGRADRR